MLLSVLLFIKQLVYELEISEVIVDETKGQINYHLVDISSK